jgi:hypothetical protein
MSGFESFAFLAFSVLETVGAGAPEVLLTPALGDFLLTTFTGTGDSLDEVDEPEDGFTAFGSSIDVFIEHPGTEQATSPLGSFVNGGYAEYGLTLSKTYKKACP